MQDYKNNKILELKKEMVKVPNQTDYEINGIDTSRAIYFYRKEKEKFKIIPRGSYTIVDEASNKYLRITDSNLLGEAIEFQVCYLFVKTSSSYIDDFPEIVLLQEHYNQLYEDFNNLLQQLQSNNILGDTLKMSYVLPQLNEGQVWVLRQGEMKAEDIFDLDSRIKEAYETFKLLFSKWVDNTEKPRIDAYIDEKLQIANDEINSKTELEKIELEDYTEQKKNELDVYLTGRKPIQYGTITELQASSNLKIGDFVEVAGYYTVGDGAGGNFIITKTSTSIALSNGLFAYKINIDIEGYVCNEVFKSNTGEIPLLEKRRIPSIIKTKKSLISVCDARESGADLPSKIKVVMKKSDTQGIVWSKPKIIMDLGDTRETGIGDPLLIYNNDTDRLFCFALNLATGNILDRETDWGFYVTHSDDDGETWSEVKKLNSLAPHDYRIIFNGIGNGCYHNGVLYVPIQCWQNLNEETVFSKSGVMLSRDNGVTWEVKKLVDNQTSECSCAIYKGRLLLSCKDETQTVGRFLFTSNDDGETWNEVIQNDIVAGSEASIITLKKDDTEVVIKSENEGFGKSVPRKDMCIKISKDLKKWQKIKIIRDDIGDGYSSLTSDKDYVYVVYEKNSSEGIGFKRYSIEEFINNGTTIEEYSSRFLQDPKMIDDYIYIKEETEIIKFTQANKNWLKRIKCDLVGKILTITTDLENIHFGIETVNSSVRYGITSYQIGQEKQLKLFKNDEITLRLNESLNWEIIDIKQSRVATLKETDIVNGVLDLKNYTYNNFVFKESDKKVKITEIRNFANRGEINISVITNSVLILEDGKNRVLINSYSPLKIKSNYFSTSYDVAGCKSQQTLIIDKTNIEFLLEPDTALKTLKTFDNVNNFYINMHVSDPFINNEFSFIKTNVSVADINFVFARELGGKFLGTSSSMAGYKSIARTVNFKNGRWIILKNTDASNIGNLYTYVVDFFEGEQSISGINTPYHVEKMKSEGVYNDFITYMDEKTAYDNQEREKEKAMQLAYREALKENPDLIYEEFISTRPTIFSRRKRSLEIQEPVPSQALLEFKERYLG